MEELGFVGSAECLHDAIDEVHFVGRETDGDARGFAHVGFEIVGHDTEVLASFFGGRAQFSCQNR